MQKLWGIWIFLQYTRQKMSLLAFTNKFYEKCGKTFLTECSSSESIRSYGFLAHSKNPSIQVRSFFFSFFFFFFAKCKMLWRPGLIIYILSHASGMGSPAITPWSNNRGPSAWASVDGRLPKG